MRRAFLLALLGVPASRAQTGGSDPRAARLSLLDVFTAHFYCGIRLSRDASNPLVYRLPRQPKVFQGIWFNGTRLTEGEDFARSGDVVRLIEHYRGSEDPKVVVDFIA